MGAAIIKVLQTYSMDHAQVFDLVGKNSSNATVNQLQK